MKNFSLFFVLVLHSLFIFAQIPSVAGSALDKFYTDFPEEKVYLQTDRSIYAAGETIWMKAWCVAENKPTFLSRVLYVELVNKNGEVVQKKMYKLDSLGSASADVDIAPSMSSGTYSLNSYTLWMQNFPEFIFRKQIYIQGKEDKATASASTVSAALHVSFFPEGGDLIEGLDNRIAFKVTDNNSMPVSVKGYITDSIGNHLININTEHNGMGAFDFFVQAGKQYMANLYAGTGSVVQFKLPVAKVEGIRLKVINVDPYRLSIRIDRSKVNRENYGKLKVLAHGNNLVVYEANLDLDRGQNTFALNKGKLPPGILHITVFDINNTPLAERLTFIENYSVTYPEVTLDTLNFAPRTKSTLTFSLPFVSNPSVSVAVTKADSDTSEYENTIVSSLLLTGDLKGYIHQPGYYFKDKEPPTLRHLDLLLMTQGWRRFEWKKILADQFAKLNYPIESGIWLSGKVTKSDRKEPLKDGKLHFIIKGSDSSIILAEPALNANGEFLLDNLSFKKKANISFQGTNLQKLNRVVDVRLNPSYFDTLTRSVNTPFNNMDSVYLRQQKAFLDYYQDVVVKNDTAVKGFLGNVTVRTKKITDEDSLNNAYTWGPFADGKLIDPRKFRYSNQWQILAADVPGIDIVMGQSGLPIRVEFSRFDTEAVFFLNEVQVDIDVIHTIPLQDIALIKVLKNEAAQLGFSGGAIAIYTRKGPPDYDNVWDKTFTTIEKEGYSLTRTFYVPELTDLAPGKDKRMTLYWNSNVKPAQNGDFQFSFRNDDATAAYKLIIQGIDSSGKLIYIEQFIK